MAEVLRAIVQLAETSTKNKRNLPHTTHYTFSPKKHNIDDLHGVSARECLFQPQSHTFGCDFTPLCRRILLAVGKLLTAFCRNSWEAVVQQT